MKRFWILVPALALFAMLVSTATPASAQGGRTVFGEAVTIESGEKVDGDLIVVGGSVTVERGAEVGGNVVVLGGPIKIAGHVEGDVVAFGGPIDLRDSAVVEGDVVFAGGPVHRSDGAVVEGNVVEGFPFQDSRLFRFAPGLIPRVPSVSPEAPIELREGSGFLSFVGGLFTDGLIAVGLAFIALLLLILVPEQTRTVKQMSADQPIASAGVGCLTIFVAVVVLVALVLTLCGIPIAAILGLVLVMALLYGWIALGCMVGERLLGVLSTERPLPLISAVVGVLLITLLALLVPCLGPVLALLGLIWGLGAVVLSRGGTRSQPALPGGWRPGSSAPPPAGPSAPEEAQATEEQPAARPVEAADPLAEGLDNLQTIKGIGPMFERMLREAGIRTYSDLASRSPQTLVEAVSGPAVVPVSLEAAQDWVAEARRLAEEYKR